MSPKADVLQGTLDLLVLKTLDTMGSMHGYGIARLEFSRSRKMCCNSSRARSIRRSYALNSKAGYSPSGAFPKTIGGHATTR